MPRAFAVRLDAAAVQLHQAAHQREADAEPSLRAVRLLIALHEQLEHRSQTLGRNPPPVVADADDHLAGLPPAVDRDMPARFGVLRRVVKEVRDHLSQAHQVAIDVEGSYRHVHRKMVLSGFEERPGHLHCARYCSRQIEPLAPQIDLPHRRPGDVQQIVHQARQVRDLALDHRALAFGGRILGPHPHHVQGGDDGSERVAQLVAENSEELVLVPIGFEQLPRQGLGLAPRQHRIGDLDGMDHHVLGVAAQAFGGLCKEVEEALRGLARQPPQPWVLVPEERITGPVDPFQDLPGRARLGSRNGLAPGPPHQIRVPDEPFEGGIREHERLFRTAQDGDRRRSLHEQGVEVLAVGVGFGPCEPFPALDLFALHLLRGNLAKQDLFAPVLLEKEPDLGEHRFGCERLHDVVDGAVRISLDDVLLLPAHRRDEDDRRVPRPLPLTDERRGLESVQLRHLDVEEN